MIWRQCIASGICRLVERKNDRLFTQQELITQELADMARDAARHDVKDIRPVSDVLAELIREGIVTRQRDGFYLLMVEPSELEHSVAAARAAKTAPKKKRDDPLKFFAARAFALSLRGEAAWSY